MELLTARLRIIGNSGGTTVVRMRMQRRKSFYLLRSALSMPWSRTYPAVNREQIRRNRIIHNPSLCSIFGFYAWAMTLLTNFPLEVSKPVLRAKPIQHFTGGRGIVTLTPLESNMCCNSS